MAYNNVSFVQAIIIIYSQTYIFQCPETIRWEVNQIYFWLFLVVILTRDVFDDNNYINEYLLGEQETVQSYGTHIIYDRNKNAPGIL